VGRAFVGRAFVGRAPSMSPAGTRVRMSPGIWRRTLRGPQPGGLAFEVIGIASTRLDRRDGFHRIDVQASGCAQSQHGYPSKCDEKEQEFGEAGDG
jgi:hypothetical protein